MSNYPVTAHACNEAFNSGEVSARELATDVLDRIASQNEMLNAFIDITGKRALAEADALDKMRQQGDALPALAAVPYAVKNLFDVEGVTTLAGAKLLSQNSVAARDAVLVERMSAAGGLLLGTLNMDALAYGFTTENTHYGVTRNPHDWLRSAGGSSGGTGAAVAAGLVPIGLGSDTNGSIRVPSSLCGVFGLKPTYGRLPRTGSFPFVASFDHLGPLAGNTQDLSLAYDAMQGHDAGDPACAQRPIANTLDTLGHGMEGLRVARLTGYFDENAGVEARWAATTAAAALGAVNEVELMDTDKARAAAFVITASEGGALHFENLRDRPHDFEPLSVDRLTAGTLVPASWYQQAQRYRRLYLERMLSLFEQYDLLIAPATPVTAPLLGQQHITIGARQLPTRPNLGLLTQPISFVGMPVAVAPMWPEGGLPIGVQLIAAPWREDICLRAARMLEQQGLAYSRIPESTS
ncbi:AtzE family amidohydrolase [Sulfuriferula nivalis]|uniref:Amidase n=1 Tax=Sulfuriferula nivalis TaxID=2675298 RepID=A0A809S930_9PROT|nr:AtzE family amidohydrolase [Sulfuriferula nivalis]BBP00963.1 amidase [Sulfuriferula nivalis]